MNRFGRGKTGGFASLLRSAGSHGINMPANNKQMGAKPQAGGSGGNRRPNDSQTQKHMDAKTSAGHQPGGARISHGARKATHFGDVHEPRIARGSAGTEGRTIHHKTNIKMKTSVPGHQAIGANRTKFSKGRAGMFKGSSGMSPEVEGHEGTPGHESVINRGIKPTGGYKHSRKASAGRITSLAKKLSFHSSIH